MSYKHLDVVRKIKTGSATTKAVLLALAMYANEKTGLAFPSTVTISEELELSKRSVIRSLDALVKSKFIEETGRGIRGVKVYKLDLEHLAKFCKNDPFCENEGCHSVTSEEPDWCHSVTSDRCQSVTSQEDDRCHSVTSLVTECHVTGDTESRHWCHSVTQKGKEKVNEVGKLSYPAGTDRPTDPASASSSSFAKQNELFLSCEEVERCFKNILPGHSVVSGLSPVEKQKHIIKRLIHLAIMSNALTKLQTKQGQFDLLEGFFSYVKHIPFFVGEKTSETHAQPFKVRLYALLDKQFFWEVVYTAYEVNHEECPWTEETIECEREAFEGDFLEYDNGFFKQATATA